MNVELQPAYILHTRPYRDTSMLIDFFTPQMGRVTAVARGVRSKKNARRNLLNPFSRLLISYQGKSGLKLLTHFESEQLSFSLTAKHLYSGFYLNELLLRLLPEQDAHEELFLLYENALKSLALQMDLEPILRHFELRLLESLGYGIHFEQDAKTGLDVKSGEFYVLDTALGFYLPEQQIVGMQLFLGEHLLAIGQGDYASPQVKQAAKRITRILLRPLLGSKPLASRELFA